MLPSWFEGLGARTWTVARGVIGQLDSPSVAVYWVYLLTAAAVATVVYARRRGTLAGVLAYLLPRRIWLSRSTLDDLGLFVANTLLHSFVLLAPLQWISTTLAQHTWAGLHGALGPISRPWSGTGASVALALAAFVVADLAFYLAHRILHRIPVLWRFHAVHHSATSLQPFTVLRRHPIDILVDRTVAGAGLGPLFGLAGWLGGGALSPWTIFGVNGLLVLALLAGFPLQHSHVWLSFGPLDRWWISPATHQLHHSADPAHHDRNFGNMLAIWDRLGGSLLLPATVAPGFADEPALRFGLGEVEDASGEHRGLWRLYLLPLLRAGQWLGKWLIGVRR